MKHLFLGIGLVLAGVSAQAAIDETAFFNKVYGASDGATLELHPEEDPDDKGFRNCVLRRGKTVYFDCSWEYAPKEKALIVWIAGNRDYWTADATGNVLSDGDDHMKATGQALKKITSAELVGRAYRENFDSDHELVLLGGDICVERWGGREKIDKARYQAGEWSVDKAMTEVTLTFNKNKRKYKLQPGGRVLSEDRLHFVQLTY